MIILSIICAALLLLVILLGFATFNLMKKQEKSEDILLGYLTYLDRLSRVIDISNKKLKEIDQAGMFEKDDDVGVIFQSILKVQDILNEFNLKKINPNG